MTECHHAVSDSGDPTLQETTINSRYNTIYILLSSHNYSTISFLELRRFRDLLTFACLITKLITLECRAGKDTNNDW